MKLIKSLIEGDKKIAKNKNILNGLGGKPKESSSRIDDNSMDQFSGVDFLMDENILTNESREEEADSHNVRTPNGLNRQQNVSSINQINSAAFSNHQAMKKIKSSGKVITSKASVNTKAMAAPSNLH